MAALWLIALSATVIVVFGYRQFNQWTEGESKNEGSDSELLAFAPPKSFTPFGRFSAVALLYCLTLLGLYGVLYAVFNDPPLGGDFLQVAGVTPDNAWLVALFVVTGLSPIIPVFSNIERSVREVMHTWAVVPGKAHQMADGIASPSTEFAFEQKFLEDVVMPRVAPVLTVEDFGTVGASTPALKWARLNYLLYKFAPPAEEGLLARKLKSPYTTRFHQDFLALKKEVEDAASVDGALLRSRPNSPATLALSEKMDFMLHRLYVLMSCRAFASTRSWEGAVIHFRRNYGISVANMQGASFPTGPVFDGLFAVAACVFLASFLFALFVPGAENRVNPTIWALSSLATHGLGVLAGWAVFDRKRRREEPGAFRSVQSRLSREHMAAASVLGYCFAVLPTWLATLYYLQSSMRAIFAHKPYLEVAATAFLISWPWALLGAATALVVYYHLERTANAPLTPRMRLLSGLGQGGLYVALALLIVLAHNPVTNAARPVAEKLADPVVQLVFLLTALIGLLLGLFLPAALYRHGRDRRGGVVRYAARGERRSAVLTFTAQQVEGELCEISLTGCVVRLPLRAAQRLSGKYGNVTLDERTPIPAQLVREVRSGPDFVELALGFSCERRFQFLPRDLRARLSEYVARQEFQPTA